ncbi:MAG: lipoyl synthase, partial [Nitrospinae bacterium]|nr:lipoyl synthase [Nitrospinota bacterium]
MEKNEKEGEMLRRLPAWMKVSLPGAGKFFDLRTLVRENSVHTVCESASCPNIGHCWANGALTLMILGDRCTRACRFCDVATGNVLPLDPDEPEKVARILSLLKLKYAVITSVDRDDLPDGGAAHWAETIRKTREYSPELKLEVLIPDFKGDLRLVGRVCESAPHVLAHNIETVPSLQEKVRPQCRYKWSLDTLRHARSIFGLTVKSGIMLGMGEKKGEVIQAMEDLVAVGCSILTLGQYLRPSRSHLEVVEYVSPEVFSEYKAIGESLGLDHVEAVPLVRSSFNADKQAQAAGLR